MKQVRVRWKVAEILLAGALAVGVVACGSSPSSTTPPASPTSSAPSTTGNSAAQQAVAANWVAFFNAKTPVNRRIALLENGPTFAAIIRHQAGDPLAKLASAKVTKVTISSPTQAQVEYSILIGGSSSAGLPGQHGVAVKQNGTWKVGVASFCGLLITENAGKTSGLPAACQTTG